MLNFPIPSFTLCQKNAISPKVFHRFSKTFLLLQDVENRYLGWKFHGRSYFSLAMAKRKLLQKGNVKFPNSKLYTVSDKMLYHQSYSTDFQKLSFCWKMWNIGICVEKFMSAAILVSQWQGENFFQVEEFEISHIQAVHCVGKNAISPKVFNRFLKTFLLLEDVENGYLGRKFHERSYFSFAMARWKFLERDMLNFPIPSFTLCQKNAILQQGIQPIFKNFPTAERCGK